LPVDQQNPEDRIAELERQLAEANRTAPPYTGSGMPPPPGMPPPMSGMPPPPPMSGMPPPSMTSAVPPPSITSAMPPIPMQPYSPTRAPGGAFGGPFGGGPTPYGFGYPQPVRRYGGARWLILIPVLVVPALGIGASLFATVFHHRSSVTYQSPSVSIHSPSAMSGPAGTPGATAGGANPGGTSGESGTGSTGSGATAKVLIDGQEQDAPNSPLCSTSGGNVHIRIGLNDGAVAAVLSAADPPVVTSVQAGTMGMSLQYAAGAGQGDAAATKNGNTYKITGHTTNQLDFSNSNTLHSFEVDVTCP
jgi:lipoprotein LpqH